MRLPYATTHSPDGTASMSTMLRSAQRLGLAGITFTEHAEWYPGDEAYGYLDLDAYFAELETTRACCADGTRLLAGIELGNPHEFPEEAAALLARYPFDLVIGSVHWLDNLPGWERPIFEQGIEATYQRYFEEVVKMVGSADFDILDIWTSSGAIRGTSSTRHCPWTPTWPSSTRSSNSSSPREGGSRSTPQDCARACRNPFPAYRS